MDRLDEVESENAKCRKAITQYRNQLLALGIAIEPIEEWIVKASRKIGVGYSSLYRPAKEVLSDC